jgi:DNA-binding MarR family transcriptional regulator
MREISQALHVSPRTITDMIDGLEVRGLVARCPHPSDRRVTLLHLTEAGVHELLGANTAAERVAATAISDLDAGEQHTLRSLLERVCLPASEPLRDRLNRAPA